MRKNSIIVYLVGIHPTHLKTNVAREDGATDIDARQMNSSVWITSALILPMHIFWKFPPPLKYHYLLIKNAWETIKTLDHEYQ